MEGIISPMSAFRNDGSELKLFETQTQVRDLLDELFFNAKDPKSKAYQQQQGFQPNILHQNYNASYLRTKIEFGGPLSLG